jgi:glycosyl transferase family 25
MNIYVISLTQSPRRKIIKKHASNLGIDLSFIDATDGTKLTLEKMDVLYDKRACLKRHGRELTNNEIACFLSHIKAWRIISNEDFPCVVLEDDAILASNFLSGIAALEFNTQCADVVLLGHSKLLIKHERYHYFKNPLYNKIYFRNFSIGNVYKLWTSGMVGYWLTPTAAKKLIDNNLTICSVSDDWNYHQKNGLRVKELRPYIVSENFLTLPSSLENERRKISKYKKRPFLEPVRIAVALIRHIQSFLTK